MVFGKKEKEEKEEKGETTFQALELLQKLEKGEINPENFQGKYLLVADQSMRWWKHDNLIKVINKLAEYGWKPTHFSTDPSGAGNIVYVLLEKQ